MNVQLLVEATRPTLPSKGRAEQLTELISTGLPQTSPRTAQRRRLHFPPTQWEQHRDKDRTDQGCSDAVEMTCCFCQT